MRCDSSTPAIESPVCDIAAAIGVGEGNLIDGGVGVGDGGVDIGAGRRYAEYATTIGIDGAIAAGGAVSTAVDDAMT